MADYTGDGKPDLVFIKTANTVTGLVEIHIASASSNYAQRVLKTGTAFPQESKGTWLMADYTGTNTVEVHVTSAESGYRSCVLETGTTFGIEYNGVWTMADTTGNGKLDLIYIKTSNTGRGSVEVHIAGGALNYQAKILETGTTFASEIDSTWSMIP
ncbi:hypothetical protein MMC17_009522 [Xylographa soralifera]|nr:hypothetical protein [Xylographa soralifera]